MYLKHITFGFDLGDTFFHSDSRGNKVIFPRAIEVVARCCKACRNVYIISKVNEQQRLRALVTLERYEVYKQTGLPRDHVFFCGARNQKGIIARKLGINCFVDDRPEVMSYMDKTVYQILFNPNPIDTARFNLTHLPVVHSWTEVERLLFEGNIE